MPPDIAHGLLVALLSASVFERLGVVAGDYKLEVPMTPTIQ